VAFAQVLGAFSLIVNQFQSISSFAAVIARLSVLVRGRQEGPPCQTAVAVIREDTRIAYDGLTLFSHEGGGEVLKNLSADIPRGTRVLVVGPNETARTALFRATAGTWPSGVGTLVRPPLDAVLFLPQRPYLPPGTLRDLLHVGQEQVITDDQITTVLHDAGLDSLQVRAAGLDREPEWSAILSLGQQQLLALTRLILARPAFAMLDRIHTTLKPAQVRRALHRLDENSITYITLTDEAESVELYDAVLEIDIDGAWCWRATGSRTSAA
jgi:vitamin B12/bleomycin/antimicrobial peptide transport system ATP-binding/permease protein